MLVDTTAEEAEVVATLPRASTFVRGDPMEGKALDERVISHTRLRRAFADERTEPAPARARLVLVYENGAMPVVVLTKRDLAGG